MRKIFALIILLASAQSNIWAETEKKLPQQDKQEEELYEEPYRRPIGVTFNLAALSSLTYEGRFQLGLSRRTSLIVSPSYQNTMEIPWYSFEKEYESVFSIKRFNLGTGVRFHSYDYDSRHNWYFEPMLRTGLAWMGDDPSVWSVIPAFMIGYTAIYDLGYTVSFGLGLEYEFIFGEKGYYTDHVYSSLLNKIYVPITKVPLTGEFSLGWTW